MWGTQLSALESCAAEHDRFATQLVTNVADPLRAIAVRYEELRKAHVEFSSRLERDRESNYSELRKLKVKYDVVCQEVESRRKKVDGSGDYGKSKAQHAMAQQVAEMNNVKVEATALSLVWKVFGC